MIINRVWCMPNKNTFSIKPIKELINKYNDENYISIDPFANNSKIAKVSNDLDKIYDTDYHLDALVFLNIFADNTVDLILNDPPYCEHQLKTVYNNKNGSKHFSDDDVYWNDIYKIYYNKLKKGGYLLTFGWKTSGSNLKDLFETVEILLVPHGGIHYDTICVVEKKI